MFILRNDKVVLIKEMGELKIVGETFEVANVTETAVVLRDAKNKIAVGAVDIAVFDQYFKKPEEVKGWTSWQRLVDQLGNTIAFYRTNQKKVQVRTTDNIRAEATCNKCDEFNLAFGIRLAMTRCEIKMLKHIYSEYTQVMERMSGDIKMKEDMVRKMIKSIELEKAEG